MRPRPEWLLTWLVSRNSPWDQLLPSVRCYYGAAFELRASAPAIGSLLATPYVLDYDLVMLAIAIAFVARHSLAQGFCSGEINMLGIARIMPLLTRTIAGAVEIPIGLVVRIAF